jgi:hypothetical protein
MTRVSSFQDNSMHSGNSFRYIILEMRENVEVKCTRRCVGYNIKQRGANALFKCCVVVNASSILQKV